MGLIYYAIGNFLFQIFLAITLISLICRHNPDDHRAVIFQKLMYSCLTWAAFDLLMILNQKFLDPQAAFRLYGLLSFMFLAFPPLAIQLILSLIRELTRREKNLILLPFILLYLFILVFPEYSNARTFGIEGGFSGSLPPWNVCFKILSIGASLSCVGLLLALSFKDEDPIIRMEKRLLSLGAILFIAGIILSQVLIRINPDLPWFANLSTALFSITAFVSLKKYGHILSSRALFETTVNISPNGISHISNDRIIWMNPSMAALLNTNEKNRLNIREIIHEIQPGRMTRQEVIKEILEGSIKGTVIYVQNGTRDPLACLAGCAPLEADRPDKGLLLILTDVSEENRIKKELFDLNRKLEKMAHIDSLTKVANRRRFDQVLLQEWQRARRNRTPLSLALLDIDFFKSYNDCYGHGKGDACLYAVAQKISTSVNRPTDLACRIGGEEFCVILPDTPLKGALAIAEKLRSCVESLELPHPESSISDHVTVSIGVCCADESVDLTPETLLQKTDEALYQAKQTGRNRVEIS